MDDKKALYREYMLRQQQLEDNRTSLVRSFNGTQSLVALARYLGVRFALHAAIYPLESTILLLQVCSPQSPHQHHSHIDGEAAQGMDKDDQEQSSLGVESVDEYERYLLRPSPTVSAAVREQAALLRPVDDAGYLRGDGLGQPSLFLAKHKSLWTNVSSIVHQNGLFSLWQGYSAHYWYLMLAESIGGGVEEVVGLVPPIRRWLEGLRGPVGPALVTCGLQALVGTLLVPLEVARLHLLLAADTYANLRRLDGISGALALAPRWYPHWLLSFVTKFGTEAGNLLPGILLELYVAKHDAIDAGNPWHQAALIGCELAMRAAVLLVTLPLETLRMRLMAADVDPDAYDRRVPLLSPSSVDVKGSTSPSEYVKGSSSECMRGSPSDYMKKSASVVGTLRQTVREEGWGALFQGWSVRVAQHAVHLLSDWLLHLNDQLLQSSDAEDF